MAEQLETGFSFDAEPLERGIRALEKFQKSLEQSFAQLDKSIKSLTTSMNAFATSVTGSSKKAEQAVGGMMTKIQGLSASQQKSIGAMEKKFVDFTQSVSGSSLSVKEGVQQIESLSAAFALSSQQITDYGARSEQARAGRELFNQTLKDGQAALKEDIALQKLLASEASVGPTASAGPTGDTTGQVEANEKLALSEGALADSTQKRIQSYSALSVHLESIRLQHEQMAQGLSASQQKSLGAMEKKFVEFTNAVVGSSAPIKEGVRQVENMNAAFVIGAQQITDYGARSEQARQGRALFNQSLKEGQAALKEEIALQKMLASQPSVDTTVASGPMGDTSGQVESNEQLAMSEEALAEATRKRIESYGTLEQQAERTLRQNEQMIQGHQVLNQAKAKDSELSAAQIRAITSLESRQAAMISRIERSTLSEKDKAQAIEDTNRRSIEAIDAVKKYSGASVAAAKTNDILTRTLFGVGEEVTDTNKSIAAAARTQREAEAAAKAQIDANGKLTKGYETFNSIVRSVNITDAQRLEFLNRIKTAHSAVSAAVQTYGAKSVEAKQANVDFALTLNRVRNELAEAGKVARSGSAGVQQFQIAMQDTTKSVQLALGPLSGVASRITALSGLFSQNNAGVALLISSFVGLSVATKHIVKEAIAYDTVMLRVESNVRALGETALFTTKEIIAMGNAFGESTLNSADASIEAILALQTFGGVTRDSFLDILKAAEGLSAVVGGDLVSNARKLGRFFEDPLKNMDSLRRSGIQFNQVQKDQIETLGRTLQLNQRNAVLLEEFRKRGVLDVAEDQAKGVAGQFDTMLERLGQIGKSIGQQKNITDGLAQSISEVNSKLLEVKDNAAFIETLAAPIKALTVALTNTFTFLVKNIEIVIAAVAAITGAAALAGVVRGFLLLGRIVGATSVTMGDLTSKFSGLIRGVRLAAGVGAGFGASMAIQVSEADKLEAGVNSLSERLAFLKGSYDDLPEDLKIDAGGAIELLEENLVELESRTKEAASQMTGFEKAVRDTGIAFIEIGKLIKTVGGFLVEFFITGPLKAAPVIFNTIKDAILGTINSLSDSIKPLSDYIAALGRLNPIVNVLSASFSTLQKADNWIEGKLTTAVNALPDLFRKAGTAAEGAVDSTFRFFTVPLGDHAQDVQKLQGEYKDLKKDTDAISESVRRYAQTLDELNGELKEEGRVVQGAVAFVRELNSEMFSAEEAARKNAKSIADLTILYERLSNSGAGSKALEEFTKGVDAASGKEALAMIQKLIAALRGVDPAAESIRKMRDLFSEVNQEITDVLANIARIAGGGPIKVAVDEGRVRQEATKAVSNIKPEERAAVLASQGVKTMDELRTKLEEQIRTRENLNYLAGVQVTLEGELRGNGQAVLDTYHEQAQAIREMKELSNGQIVDAQVRARYEEANLQILLRGIKAQADADRAKAQGIGSSIIQNVSEGRTSFSSAEEQLQQNKAAAMGPLFEQENTLLMGGASSEDPELLMTQERLEAIRQEYEQHYDELNEMQKAAGVAQLQSVADSFGTLAGAIKEGGGESNRVYKAFAMAQIAISQGIAISKAIADAQFEGAFGTQQAVAALKIAAISIQMGQAMASVSRGGFKDGGYVSGAGTSRSDSIPAMLSNKEYVINAAAVKQVGLPYLDAINRGMRPMAVPKFKDGGYVSEASRNPNLMEPMSSGGNSKPTQVFVEINDMRGSGSPVEVSQGTDAFGNERIKVTVRDAMRQAIASGEMDGIMASAYGTRRRAVAR